MRWFVMKTVFVISVSTLGAQAPQQPAGPFQQASPYNNLPNYYYRGNAPLSPYLNVLRGGSPAVNYYYGVRPGLPSGGYVPYGSVQQIPRGPQIQPGFIPVSPTIVGQPAGFNYATAPQETTLSPAGHPVQFFNPYGPSGIVGGVNSPPRPGGFSRPQPSSAPPRKP
jgi:hypothetical protein